MKVATKPPAVVLHRVLSLTFCICCFLLLCVPCGGSSLLDSAAPEDDENVVRIKNGLIKGQLASWIFESEGREFLGIPYALPPVGTLRYLPPLAYNKTWEGTRDATSFGYDCPQHGIGSAHTDENCLFLNVYTPLEMDHNDPYPVMVFLYGGSWEYGASSIPVYTGRYILDYGKDVILVTLNYRLGALGYLGSKILAQETKDGTTGNMGLLDQRLALHWVRENIEAFGGDKNNIMLFGESAGAGSVSNHLIMPNSWGLFKHAAMESGPFAHWTARPLADAEEQFRIFIDQLNCSSGTSVQILACIRKASVADILDVHTNIAMYFTEWSPVVDGVEITALPETLAKEGKLAPGVNVLLGTNRNEGTLFANNVSKTMNDTQYMDYLVHRYGPFAKELYKYYPPSNYKTNWDAATAIIGDGDMTCAARRTARWISQTGSNAYLYFFTHEIEEVRLVDPSIGVFHGSELFFVFKVPSAVYDYQSEIIPIFFTYDETILQDKFVDYWTQFAATGNPNSGSSVPWPRYEAETDQNIQLDLSISVDTHLKKTVCDWWDTVYMHLN